MAVMLAVGRVGLDLGPLIAGAGIAGIALGFGAQSLVKDWISGLFMTLEDQYGVGDIIDVGEASGVVERITLRATVLRGVDGTVWHVPNGQIVRVGNRSQLWSVALLDVTVAYEADLGRATALLHDVATELCAREEYAGSVLEAPQVLGVEALGVDGVTLRLTSRWRPERNGISSERSARPSSPPSTPTPWRSRSRNGRLRAGPADRRRPGHERAARLTRSMSPMNDVSALAITTRPDTPMLVIAIAVTALGWLALRRAVWAAAPPRPAPAGNERPRAARNGWMEPPAVVGLLTNDYTVPPTAVTATALDLASRGWIQVAYAGNELVVFTRGTGRQGDVLRPFEQQVLNHLAAQTFDGVTSAATLGAAQHRLTRRWWRRFRRGVVAVAREYGLTRGRGTDRNNWLHRRWPRYSRSCSSSSPGGRATTRSAPPIRSVRVSSWIVGLAVVVALAVETVRVYLSVAELPTDDGLRRTAKWLGYRVRLLARIPDRASVVAAAGAAAGARRCVCDGCRRARRRAVVGRRRGPTVGVERRWRNAPHRPRALPHTTGVRPPTDRRHGDRGGRADGRAGGSRDAPTGRRR